jgi:hypothetical protein
MAERGASALRLVDSLYHHVDELLVEAERLGDARRDPGVPAHGLSYQLGDVVGRMPAGGEEVGVDDNLPRAGRDAVVDSLGDGGGSELHVGGAHDGIGAAGLYPARDLCEKLVRLGTAAAMVDEQDGTLRFSQGRSPDPAHRY